ncbi:methanogen output domain 1-containing protein [Pseudoruegeria sp. HB172150]|uniref:methanogen output domain 1-containing protein n=1 Tax=Pseudoruegeria sp. HB172150 TaxID=2721164 RepID=UPI001553FF16|nr:methanogen output domain 1-containing protein [Pseudoruegeria sp. HB172150]
MHQQVVETLDLPLGQETFFADTLCSLAGGLEDSVGLKGASTFISEVGSEIGEGISEQYTDAIGTRAWTGEQVAEVLVDLKRRIGGDFRVESVTEDEIVLTNLRCPFATRVRGRPSLCMMTTTVFGTVAARATGYAAVRIDKAIALGHPACRVEVRLKRDECQDGYEFFAE